MLNKKIAVLLICTSLLLGCTSVSIESDNIIETSNNNLILDKEELKYIDKKEIINELCSDEYMGRLVGSEGNKLAEKYIYDKFKEINLEYLFNDSYYQAYEQINISSMDEELIEVNNVIGKISGNSSEKAIVLSAHLDHIGIKGENIIKGAVDNASGISVLLDLASKLKYEYNIDKPKYDIIFCSFNGEEKGLFGSKAFINEIEGTYDTIYNVNIDSIGYKNGGNILLANSYERSGGNIDKNNYIEYLNLLTESFVSNGFSMSNSDMHIKSDDYAFQEKGITAITITEENIWEVIHKESDIPEVIDYDRLNLISECIYIFILSFLDNI